MRNKNTSSSDYITSFGTTIQNSYIYVKFLFQWIRKRVVKKTLGTGEIYSPMSLAVLISINASKIISYFLVNPLAASPLASRGFAPRGNLKI